MSSSLITLPALLESGFHSCHLKIVDFSMKEAWEPSFNRWLVPFWIWLLLRKTALAAFKAAFYMIKYIFMDAVIIKCVALGQKRKRSIYISQKDCQLSFLGKNNIG